MIISNHHILYDGWSNGIILKEFFGAYHESGETHELSKPAKTPFKEFLKWIQSLDNREQENYWREYLKDLDSHSRLPVKSGKITGTAMVPAYVRSYWSTDLKENLERFVKSRKITLASLIYGAWGLLLNTYTNSDDVVFGATTSGRSAKIKGIEEMVGLFINTLPLRVQTFAHETVNDFLQRLDNSMPAWETHEALPLVHIRTLCDNISDRNEELFDTLIALENYPLDLAFPPGALITPGAYHMVEMTHYDLTVGITVSGHIEISFIYNQALLEKDTVSRLAGHFKNIVETIMNAPEQEAAGLEILSEAEKKQLVFDFNQFRVGVAEGFPVNKTIYELFAGQAGRIPDQAAVLFPSPAQSGDNAGDNYNNLITYKELNERAAGMAQVLIEKGVIPGDIVAIKIERSVEMVIGILGILKSGGAYLPIDPLYPGERIDYMLKDSAARILITKSEARNSVSNFDMRISDFNSANIAYIIYTSGSTGKPKGVMVEHRSVINILAALQREYPLGETGTYLLKTSFLFDVSVAELFGWFPGGGRLAVLATGGEKDPG
ncbi:MAG TPA: condensation domain-containing protein, partial [Candidatus Deferrimicrobium sp.]|nr:condensation domain-containing protein [Candidatus Deferrimicrobium sp.]